MIRLFDILFSLLGILILFPIMLILALIISIESPGGAIFKQQRIGKLGKPFSLYKFRSMRKNSDKDGLLTIGSDNRITRSGKFLRKFKLDEIPQLFNVLFGDMSIVGPRPEVEKFVLLYSDEQKQVLDVRPGITDKASIEFIDEAQILSKSNNPEKTYIEEVMPAKINLNLYYIQKRSIKTYFELIFKTLYKIIS